VGGRLTAPTVRSESLASAFFTGLAQHVLYVAHAFNPDRAHEPDDSDTNDLEMITVGVSAAQLDRRQGGALATPAEVSRVRDPQNTLTGAQEALMFSFWGASGLTLS